MTVRTHIGEALEVAREERRRLRKKRSDFAAFEQELREGPTRSSTRGSGGGDPGDVPAAALVAGAGDATTADPCRWIREAFAGTIPPHRTGDEGSELLSAALEAGTVGEFPARTKAALLAAIADRQVELSAMDGALETETRSLRAASEGIEEVSGWIVDADEIPLPELGFEALRDHHETLSAHRSRCGDLASDRQAVLDGRSREGTVALSHRALVEALYTEFPAEYPVVATCARLIEVCEGCQRAIRAHLVRRV